MFWPTLTHYGWAVSIRTAGQFVALQVDSFHHNGWRYWVRIRTCSSRGLPTRSRSADGRTAGSRPPASADFSLRVSTSAFQPRGEISPGKNALLRCTTAGSTPPRLDHESFVVSCPLALLGSAFYPVLPPQGGAEVFIGSQLRSTLPSHTRSPSCSCASLRSL